MIGIVEGLARASPVLWGNSVQARNLRGSASLSPSGYDSEYDSEDGSEEDYESESERQSYMTARYSVITAMEAGDTFMQWLLEMSGIWDEAVLSRAIFGAGHFELEYESRSWGEGLHLYIQASAFVFDQSSTVEGATKVHCTSHSSVRGRPG